MATEVKTIKKQDGWVLVSSAAKVFGMCSENVTLRVAWSENKPANDFSGYSMPPGVGVSRDFETGHLFVLLPSSSIHEKVSFVYDEG